MAQKRKSNSRSAKRGKSSKQQRSKGGSSFGRILLGLFILLALAYGALAFKEGKLVPEVLSELKLKLPDLDQSEVAEPETKQEAPKEEKKIEAQPVEENISEESPEETPFDYDAFDLYFTAAFDFMWPAYTANDAIIERPYYTIRYNEEHEQAAWVAYKLVADSLNQTTYERKDNFREDPRVRSGSASLDDYKGSGYDRGHLAPAADFSYDEFALSQSFYMSNMSPQNPSFNRGVWKKLEDQVRDWAKANQAVYVVTGPVLNKRFKTIGKNQVSVPEYYYKIVLDIEKPEVKAIAFLMKNEKSSADLSTFVVTIDELEKLTSLDFFPSMPDELENALESSKMTSRWFK
ncbi:DNA/RNA non-specific endonuclease [Roseivirga sp.]|uniref:DNA/RNA non-specific endonuclease n=1 Tax=Roseivirga sp. TaxID=1964215 RepID=UPI003B522E67